MLKIIDSKKNKAQENMLMDEYLLDNLKNEPILHFYDWENDSLSYGYFIKIDKFIDLKKAKNMNLDLAKRPTGGGIVFHIWDIAFSFLMPKNHKFYYLDPLKNYEFVNNLVLKALEEFLIKKKDNKKDENTNLSNYYLSNKEHFNENKSFDSFCMAKPTKYDVIYNNKKIAGASQRRKNTGYLHQGSICLIKPDLKYLQDVLIEKDVSKAIFNSSYPIFSKGNINEKRLLVKEKLTKTFQNSIF